MTPTNSGRTPSALTGLAQIFWSSFRGRFREGDAVNIPLVGVTLGLALFLGRWAVADAPGAPDAQLASVTNVIESLLLGIGLALVLAAMQARQGGITILSTLSAWAVIVVASAVGAWPQRHDRALLANVALTVVASLGAVLWLHQRRR